MNVPNCNNEYCEVKRNVESKMEMKFKTDSAATMLNSQVKAQIAGIWIPWPLGPQSKVCDHLSQGKCPLSANSEATYSMSMTIPGIAPVGTRTTIEFSILDQSKNVVACTRFPVKVSA